MKNMTTKKINLLILLLIIIGLGGCLQKDLPPDEDPSVIEKPTKYSLLEGKTWRLVGIYDTLTQTVQELGPKDCIDCYTLTFNSDSTAVGKSEINIVQASLSNPYIWLTENIVEESEDARLFTHILPKVTGYEYEFGSNNFKFIYNNGKNYLLYKFIAATGMSGRLNYSSNKEPSWRISRIYISGKDYGGPINDAPMELYFIQDAPDSLTKESCIVEFSGNITPMWRETSMQMTYSVKLKSLKYN
jgi:hypothetical protein